jgi:glycosyltransferase involved in cell wall biosynthesis
VRVGIFTYGMNDQLTGIGRYTVELTRAMKGLDPELEITLITPYPDSPLPWYREFPTYPVPQLRRVPLAASLGNWTLHRAASDLDLDVLHDPCGIAPFAFPAPRYRRVTTVHDAVPLVMPRVQPLATRLIFRTLIPAARFTADAVLTVSRASAHDLTHHLGIPEHKLYVTPNGVAPPLELPDEEIERRLADLEVSAPYFLYVGALNPRKNLERVLEAFARLEERRPEMQLVVVGPDTWWADATFARARELRAQGRLAGLRFTGYVEERTLQALYRRATALVYVSLYEGFGLPALEAMVHGTAVIGSDRSAIPEAVGDAGVLVDPCDVGAIADAMERVVSSPELRADLARRGRERAARFTWEETARRTLDVYRSIVG